MWAMLGSFEEEPGTKMAGVEGVKRYRKSGGYRDRFC